MKHTNVLKMLAMGVLSFSFLFCMDAYAQVSPCCVTQSLIINTGYNPASNSKLDGGTDDMPPIHDPYWNVCNVTSDFGIDIVNTYSVTPYTVCPIGTSADIVGTWGAWLIAGESN